MTQNSSAVKYSRVLRLSAIVAVAASLDAVNAQLATMTKVLDQDGGSATHNGNAEL